MLPCASMPLTILKFQLILASTLKVEPLIGAFIAASVPQT